jgi:predicted dinucleotide-binding enzyme
MKITVIGSGNVGGTLAVAFQKAGHEVVFGVRDVAKDFKGRALAVQFDIPVLLINEAVKRSDVIVISTPAQFAADIAAELGDVSDKIIIDTMNAMSAKPGGFTNTADAILANCNTSHVVKCFNTTGYENIANPVYEGQGIDMFVAGSSEKGKHIAAQLAKEIGFANCYDFGGNDKFFAIEQLAFAWINLAILQKQGRDIAFKLIKRAGASRIIFQL